MPSIRFTDQWVRNVKPPRIGDKPKQTSYFHTLDRGLALVLVVSYGGSKTWRVLTYDTNGKAKSEKIGKFPAMTLKIARNTAREYFDNPEKFKARTETGSFKQIAEQWIRRHVDESGLRSKPKSNDA